MKNGWLKYWYIACSAKKLKQNKVIGTNLLGEKIVLWRDEKGKPRAFQDKCPHRHAQISKGGYIKNQQLTCPYHGWSFKSSGEVGFIPSDGPEQKCTKRKIKSYETTETCHTVCKNGLCCHLSVFLESIIFVAIMNSMDYISIEVFY